jgi:hypothetical protein
MRKRSTIIKAVTKSVIDFCILPGAAVGAEILWLYSIQWKNRFTLLGLALISFAYSHMQMTINERLSSGTSITEPENTR